MKKITLLLAAMVIATSAAFGQSESRWGVTAGLNFNEIHFKQHDIMPVDRMVGPQAGITGEMNFAGIGFGVEGSVLYSLRSGKCHYGDRKMWSSVGAGDETINMHYIDVPLHLKFKWHRLGGFESTLMPLLYVGPDFAFLAGGNHRELNQYPRVNVYLDMGVGCEIMERVQLRAGYDFSIGQSFHTKLLDENVAKNRTWYFNMTYFFK